MSTIGILGDGGWGTALATVLRFNGHAVRVWGPFPNDIAAIRQHLENRKFLPGVALPDDIRFTADRAEAVAGADAVVIAVPSRFYAGALRDFAPLIPAAARLVSVSKGFDRASRQRLSVVAEAILGRGPVAALSGPSHAEEVARRIPTAVAIACADEEAAAALQKLFMNVFFRVYTSPDACGVEWGGALKNVIALAAGACDGLGFGDNTKAALITRGLAEMTRLGVAHGARAATFAGLSGIGDLVVTCTSRHSRNRAVGERLGRGESLASILGGMEQVAEGVWTCATARDMARQKEVSAPITDEIFAVLHENKPPLKAVEALMSREARPE